MECGGESSNVLSYAQPRTLRPGRFAQWLERLPLWLVALLVVAPVCAFDHLGVADRIFLPHGQQAIRPVVGALYMVALFIPAALRRVDWRHLLVMLGFAAVAWGLWMLAKWPPDLPYPWWMAIWVLPYILLAGLGEWLLGHPRSRQALIRILLLAVAAALVFSLIRQPIAYVGFAISVPHASGYHSGTTLDRLIHEPLLSLLTWIAIPRALVSTASGRSIFVAAGCALASAAAFLVFFLVLVYPIARCSVVRGAPFDPWQSTRLLASRANAGDLDAMWDSLEASDWSAPEEYPYRRRMCIQFLVDHDGPEAARRLSDMVRRKPSRLLARLAAPSLGVHRRYEAAPVLARYALLGHSACTESLEEMRVPVAALAILRESVLDDRANPFAPTFTVAAERRQRLAEILGRDVGPDFRDWNKLLVQVMDDLPTPLSADVAAETDRVTDAIASYWSASGELFHARCELVATHLRQQQPGARLSYTQVLAHYHEEPFRGMTVPDPDWSVPDTEALEREVERYVRAVDDLIESRFGPATNPAPATAPADRGSTPGARREEQ